MGFFNLSGKQKPLPPQGIDEQEDESPRDSAKRIWLTAEAFSAEMSEDLKKRFGLGNAYEEVFMFWLASRINALPKDAMERGCLSHDFIERFKRAQNDAPGSFEAAVARISGATSLYGMSDDWEEPWKILAPRVIPAGPRTPTLLRDVEAHLKRTIKRLDTFMESAECSRHVGEIAAALKEQPRTAAPPPPTPDALHWQQAVVRKYPNVGKAGTPENKAFVAEFKKWGTPENAMQIADLLDDLLWPDPDRPDLWLSKN